MTTIAASAVVVAVCLALIIVSALLVLAYAMPRDRDVEATGKLFPAMFHFKLKRNDRSALGMDHVPDKGSDLEGTDGEV